MTLRSPKVDHLVKRVRIKRKKKNACRIFATGGGENGVEQNRSMEEETDTKYLGEHEKKTLIPGKT